MNPKKARDTFLGLLVALAALTILCNLSGGVGNAWPVLLGLALALAAAAIFVSCRWLRCPHCHKMLRPDRPKYCPHCGQRLYW